MTSPDTIYHAPDRDQLCQVLIEASKSDIPVLVVSNKGKPSWFDKKFSNSLVRFKQSIGRQNGDIVKSTAQTLGQNPRDVLVLTGSQIDLRMAKSGGAVLIAAQWSHDAIVRALGIRVTNSEELKTILHLTKNWSARWYYEGQEDFYHVAALADLSTYGKDHATVHFARQLTATVKDGGARLNSLLAITARSLLTSEIDLSGRIAWGIFPSSNSNNNDTDVLSDFCHRLRTTVSRVRFAERGEPLLIRHKPSPKRSAGGSGDRTDPRDQLISLHINPYYRGKLSGRHVILLDDCTTYGVSFGVAASLLRSAGATSMTGIALGKFGSQLRFYDIAVDGSPYVPIEHYQVSESRYFNGNVVNHGIQRDLRDLI